MRKRGLNRYARKRLGKRIMKRKFCTKYGNRTNEDLVRQKYEQDAASDWAWWKKRHQRNKGYLYWQQWYLSGRRKIAKQGTNRRIRSKYRERLAARDEEAIEDINAMRNSEYQKEFEYAWTIW